MFRRYWLPLAGRSFRTLSVARCANILKPPNPSAPPPPMGSDSTRVATGDRGALNANVPVPPLACSAPGGCQPPALDPPLAPTALDPPPAAAVVFGDLHRGVLRAFLAKHAEGWSDDCGLDTQTADAVLAASHRELTSLETISSDAGRITLFQQTLRVHAPPAFFVAKDALVAALSAEPPLDDLPVAAVIDELLVRPVLPTSPPTPLLSLRAHLAANPTGHWHIVRNSAVEALKASLAQYRGGANLFVVRKVADLCDIIHKGPEGQRYELTVPAGWKLTGWGNEGRALLDVLHTPGVCHVERAFSKMPFRMSSLKEFKKVDTRRLYITKSGYGEFFIDVEGIGQHCRFIGPEGRAVVDPDGAVQRCMNAWGFTNKLMRVHGQSGAGKTMAAVLNGLEIDKEGFYVIYALASVVFEDSTGKLVVSNVADFLKSVLEPTPQDKVSPHKVLLVIDEFGPFPQLLAELTEAYTTVVLKSARLANVSCVAIMAVGAGAEGNGGKTGGTTRGTYESVHIKTALWPALTTRMMGRNLKTLQRVLEIIGLAPGSNAHNNTPALHRLHGLLQNARFAALFSRYLTAMHPLGKTQGDNLLDDAVLIGGIEYTAGLAATHFIELNGLAEKSTDAKSLAAHLTVPLRWMIDRAPWKSVTDDLWLTYASRSGVVQFGGVYENQPHAAAAMEREGFRCRTLVCRDDGEYVWFEGFRPKGVTHELLRPGRPAYVVSPTYCALFLALCGGKAAGRPMTPEGLELTLADFAFICASLGSMSAGSVPSEVPALRTLLWGLCDDAAFVHGAAVRLDVSFMIHHCAFSAPCPERVWQIASVAVPASTQPPVVVYKPTRDDPAHMRQRDANREEMRAAIKAAKNRPLVIVNGQNASYADVLVLGQRKLVLLQGKTRGRGADHGRTLSVKDVEIEFYKMAPAWNLDMACLCLLEKDPKKHGGPKSGSHSPLDVNAPTKPFDYRYLHNRQRVTEDLIELATGGRILREASSGMAETPVDDVSHQHDCLHYAVDMAVVIEGPKSCLGFSLPPRGHRSFTLDDRTFLKKQYTFEAPGYQFLHVTFRTFVADVTWHEKDEVGPLYPVLQWCCKTNQETTTKISTTTTARNDKRKSH